MKKNKNDWKERLGVVYSTNPDFRFEKKDNEEELSTLPPEQQTLKIWLDRKQRKGKMVTIVAGFQGAEEDLKTLGRLLKSKCGVGGTVKNGEIMVQGDFVLKIANILKEKNYKIKLAGGGYKNG
ncbi:MAG: translation initiation factor [Draconibacterium sp.]|nr:MAG: translation initiation factor [Draconibacterium sp.]